MFNKDAIWFGLLLGIIFPGVFYIIINEFNLWMIDVYFKNDIGFSVKFRMIVSVCGNILPVIIYDKRKLGLTIKGIVIATMIEAVFILFYFFNDQFFNS